MRILLIGAGNMGGAMLPKLSKYDITVVESYQKRANELKSLYKDIKVVEAIPPLDGYMVILAIKPQSFKTLVTQGEADGLISIMAGVDLESLKKGIKAKRYIRSMPNLAAISGKSATSVCGDKDLKEDALEILSSIGDCFWLESEDELNIATAIAGSAPAWMALVAESLSDGAVKCGLKRDISYKFIASLFDGMGDLIRADHPGVLKDKVTSPGGTTIMGYSKLEEGGVRNSFIKAVEITYERAKKI